MKAFVAPVRDRFTKSTFGNGWHWEYPYQAPSMYSFYSCPKCPQQVRFQETDFRDKRNQCKLSPQESRLVQEALFGVELKGSSFLDWHCPGCQMAVRIRFFAWAGGHPGEEGYEIEYVVEVS